VVRRAEVATVLARNPQEYHEQAVRIEAAKVSAKHAWDAYAATITPGEERGLADRIIQAQDAYYAEQVKTTAQAEKPENHEQALGQYLGASRKTYAALGVALQADRQRES